MARSAAVASFKVRIPRTSDGLRPGLQQARGTVEFKPALRHAHMNFVRTPVLEGFRRVTDEGMGAIAQVTCQIFAPLGGFSRHHKFFTVIDLNAHSLPGLP